MARTSAGRPSLLRSHQPSHQDDQIELANHCFKDRKRTGYSGEGSNISVTQRGDRNKTIVKEKEAAFLYLTFRDGKRSRMNPLYDRIDKGPHYGHEEINDCRADDKIRGDLFFSEDKG